MIDKKRKNDILSQFSFFWLFLLHIYSFSKGFIAKNKQLVDGAKRNAKLKVKKGRLQKGGACKTTDIYCFAVTYKRHPKAPTLVVKARGKVWIKTNPSKTKETLRVTVNKIGCSAALEVSYYYHFYIDFIKCSILLFDFFF